MYFPDMPGRQSMVIFIAIYKCVEGVGAYPCILNVNQEKYVHMAGFYQPQHFFAARCVFTDFEALISATI